MRPLNFVAAPLRGPGVNDSDGMLICDTLIVRLRYGLGETVHVFVPLPCRKFIVILE